MKVYISDSAKYNKEQRELLESERDRIATKFEEAANGRTIGPFLAGPGARTGFRYAAGWVRGKVACRYCEGIGNVLRKDDGERMECSPCEGSGLVFPEQGEVLIRGPFARR
jgi:hypothetical protein